MVIWGDHTWHGSYPKETDGLRLMVLGMYNRPHMQTQEAYRQTATPEALARNPVRFTQLMNVHHGMPWGKSGLRYKGKGLSNAPKGYVSLFDTEPVGEGVELPAEYDYHVYDRELGNQIKEIFNANAKAKRYQFPDLYKDAPRDPRPNRKTKPRVEEAAMDHPIAARAGAELTRTQTQMQGASFCDFRYRRRA